MSAALEVAGPDGRTDLELTGTDASVIVEAKKGWLVDTYLAGATAVRNPADQWTYCMVVSNDQFGTESTFREFVRDRRIYFHPYGGTDGWPKRPPTLLAFRWQGYVQQVNRVEQYQIVAHLNDRFLDIPREPGEPDDPHIVHDLGPDIPIPDIRTKGIYATARVWALLDQMLTAPTLKEVVDRSKVIDPT